MQGERPYVGFSVGLLHTQLLVIRSFVTSGAPAVYVAAVLHTPHVFFLIYPLNRLPKKNCCC